jgi:acyl-CoA dehydrogenase
MDLGISDRVRPLYDDIKNFIDTHIVPNEKVYADQLNEGGDRWKVVPVLEELKAKAKEQGLWNFFLPESDRGAGLTNVDYAHIAELMGKYPLSSETMNCSAPDTGNMEVLERYGTPEQQEQWLKPLLER